MSIREASRQFGLSKSALSEWVLKTRGRRLDRVEFGNAKRGRAWNRMNPQVERRIARLRIELKNGVLGEYGARAIQRHLQSEMQDAPSEAAINRALKRLGLQDATRRLRRSAPPKGWYLPAVVAAEAELDSFDFIEELKIAQGPLIDVLTAKSLHGGLSDAWPMPSMSAKAVVTCLLERWQRDGLPHYAQFDNDTVFQGAHQFADTVGRVSRVCLQLGVSPVFVPPLEHGMQNIIESFNALWQAKLWQRHRVVNLGELQQISARYILAHRARASTADLAPARRRMPRSFRFDPRRPVGGCMIFIRRTDETGNVHMLGQRFAVSRLWIHRLVRCEVDFSAERISCYALRRQEPAQQSLLAEINYKRTDKPFKGDL